MMNGNDNKVNEIKTENMKNKNGDENVDYDNIFNSLESDDVFMNEYDEVKLAFFSKYLANMIDKLNG